MTTSRFCEIIDEILRQSSVAATVQHLISALRYTVDNGGLEAEKALARYAALAGLWETKDDEET